MTFDPLWTTCPTCEARPGQGCLTRRGTPKPEGFMHVARQKDPADYVEPDTIDPTTNERTVQ